MGMSRVFQLDSAYRYSDSPDHHDPKEQIMNARILELEKVAATINRTILSLAREPFDVNGHEVQITYQSTQGCNITYVDGEPIIKTDPGYGMTLIATSICDACGVTDSDIIRDVTIRASRAMRG